MYKWTCTVQTSVTQGSTVFPMVLMKLVYSLVYIYIFLAALGLCCCARAFSSCGERGLLFVVVCGLLIVVASLVEQGL